MGDIKAILFDFWGTLVENGTYSPLKQTYAILRVRMPFGEFVQRFEEVFMTQKFESQEQAFAQTLEHLGMPARKALVDELIGLWNKNRLLAKPYAETFDALADLKKTYKLVLLSNTDCFVDSVLEKFSLRSYFDQTALSYEEGHLKTDPHLFEAALKKLKLSKNDVIMVGDSLETDIAGAVKAGIRAILVDRKNKRDFSPKICDLRELRECVQHV